METLWQGSFHFLLQNKVIGFVRSNCAENEPKTNNVSEQRLSSWPKSSFLEKGIFSLFSRRNDLYKNPGTDKSTQKTDLNQTLTCQKGFATSMNLLLKCIKNILRKLIFYRPCVRSLCLGSLPMWPPLTGSQGSCWLTTHPSQVNPIICRIRNDISFPDPDSKFDIIPDAAGSDPKPNPSVSRNFFVNRPTGRYASVF
jgi:hypothetical protein